MQSSLDKLTNEKTLRNSATMLNPKKKLLDTNIKHHIQKGLNQEQ